MIMESPRGAQDSTHTQLEEKSGLLDKFNYCYNKHHLETSCDNEETESPMSGMNQKDQDAISRSGEWLGWGSVSLACMRTRVPYSAPALGEKEC